jgi:NADH-quinone oxidoreductase subunit E
MIPEDFKQQLQQHIAGVEHPREKVMDVIFMLQDRFGYLSDELLEDAASLLKMTPLEVEEIATFYEFIYRRPVGSHIIHVCDGVVCWMSGYTAILDHLRGRLGIDFGETTPDGRFTLLPTCCIGYCDRAPAMMINRKVYGNLTPKRIDEILQKLGWDITGKRDDTSSL